MPKNKFIPVRKKFAPEKKKKDIIGTTFKYVGYLTAVFGLLFAVQKIFESTQSEKEKFEKEKTVQGELKPAPITTYNPATTEHPEQLLKFSDNPLKDSLPEIKGIPLPQLKYGKDGVVLFYIGKMVTSMPASTLLEGIFLRVPITIDQCETYPILFGAKDGKLYVSIDFKDLQKEQVIGSIEFNHWKLYKENMLNFDSDDQRLEVRDKQNNIAFSIKYSKFAGLDMVSIAGYFLSPNAVIVIPNDSTISKEAFFCFPKNDGMGKPMASVKIQQIKTIFPK